MLKMKMLKFEMSMKNSMKQIATILVASATLAIGTQLSHAAPLVPTNYDWTFGTTATPVTPDGSVDSAAQAVVTPGSLAVGWIDSSPILGSAQGIWDLGQLGTITVNNPDGFGGASGAGQLITVKVTQFQGGVYSQVGQVSVPGAELISQGVTIGGSGKLGVWVIQETDWRVPAGVSASSIVVTAPASRLLVDRVAVSTSAAAAVQPVLSITSLNGSQVMVSWPTPAVSVVLESTTNVNDPTSWTAVTDTVQVSGGTSSITTSALGAAKFYRLKKP
jgi:hypothetical protein